MRRTILVLIFAIFSLTACSDMYILSESDTQYNASTVDYSIYHRNGSDFSYTRNDDHSMDQQNQITKMWGMMYIKDNMLYFQQGNMVYQYDTVSGNTTTLCKDPLCRHDDIECPFFGIRGGNGIHIYDKYIYYEQMTNYYDEDDIEHRVNRRLKFDMQNQTVKTIYDIEEGLRVTSEYYYDNIRYYLDAEYTENETQEFVLKCDDLETDKSEEVFKIGQTADGICFADSEKIYFCDGAGIYYRRILNPVEKVRIYTGEVKSLICDGRYFYIIEINGDNRNLVRCGLNAEETDTLIEGKVLNISMTEKYIYYTLDDYILKKNSITGAEYKVYSDEIYRVDKNSLKNEFVYSFPDDMEGYFQTSFTVDGRYLYCHYCVYSEDDEVLIEFINNRPYDLLRIDVETGDLYYICE